jgi:hypothetical protein
MVVILANFLTKSGKGPCDELITCPRVVTPTVARP